MNTNVASVYENVNKVYEDFNHRHGNMFFYYS